MSHHDRHNRRKTLIGFVTSRSGPKSVKVTIAYKAPHHLYHKIVNRQTVVHVHDEKNEVQVGDKVRIMETRPLSRLKRWRVVQVVDQAAGTGESALTENDVAASIADEPSAPAQT